MNLLIIHFKGEYNISLDANYCYYTLYDILIDQKLLYIDTLYNKLGKKVGFKIPLNRFKTKSNHLVLFTKNAFEDWKKYKINKNISK